jgi:aminoglycoside 6'-N-acetyltransferase I
VENVQIRPGGIADLEHLAPMFEALWPQSTAEEHARELRLLLGGKEAQVLTTPIIILVAEAGEGKVVGFVEVDLRSHADGCDHRDLWDTSRAGTLRKSTDRVEWARS